MAVAELPPAVSPRLTVVERQWRELVLLRGWGAVIGVAGGGLAALLIADAFLNLPAWVRAAGLVVTGLLAVLAAWWRLWRPWQRGMTLADAAAWLERSHPELQERVLTCLDLEQTDSPNPTSRAATLMRRQVRKETFALLESVETDDALPPERAFRAFGLGLVALAIMIAPFGVWTTGYGLSWQRLFNPWGNHAWGRNWIVAGEPGDQIHPKGHDLTVQAAARHRRTADARPDQLTLHWRAAGTNDWDERRLASEDGSPHFAAVIPRLSADTVWFVTGPASASPRYRITVVDPPQIARFTADVDPLPYTGQPSDHSDVGSELSAIIGSVVRLHVEFDRPVSAVELHWPVLNLKAPAKSTAEAVAIEKLTVSADQRSATVRVRAERSGPFHLTFHSPQGLTVDDDPRRLVVAPDEPPRVQLTGGTAVTVRPDDRLDVTIVARDDFGLQTAELQLALSDKDTRTVSLPTMRQPDDGWMWSHTVDVAALDLTSGQAVSLRARVIDNRAWPSPQEAWSDPQIIVVSQSAPSAGERALTQQTNAARHDLQQLLRELAEHREELRDAHQKTAAAAVKQSDAEQDARLEELAAKQQELTGQLKNWADDLPEAGPWQQVRAAAQDVIDGQLAEANAELQQGREAEARERIEHLSRTLDDLAAAQRELQRLDDAIRALGNLGPELGELAQLANRSDRLAEELERQSREPTEQPAATPEQIQQAEQLQRDLERVIGDRPELQAAIEQAQRDRAAAEAKQAQELAKRQRQLADAIQGQTPAVDGHNPQPAGEESASQAADATKPANGPTQPATPEFTAGKSVAEQLRQAADQATRVAESLLNDLGPDAAPVEKTVQAARDLNAAQTAAEQGKLSEAREQTEQAQANLDRAAQDFPAAAAQTPPAQETKQLAAAVQQIAEQLEPIKDSSDAQRGSQAAAQQQLAEATKPLSQPQGQQPQGQQPQGQQPQGQQPQGQQPQGQQPQGQQPQGQQPQGQQPQGQQPQSQQPQSPAQQALAAAQQAMEQTQKSLQAGDSQQAADDAQKAAQQLAKAAEQMQPKAQTSKPPQNAVPPSAGEALSKAEQKLESAKECLCESGGPAFGQSKSSSQSQPGQSQSGQPQPGQQPDPSEQGQQGEGQTPGSKPGGQPSSKEQPGGQPGSSPRSQAIADFRRAGDALRDAVQLMTGDPKSPTNAAQPQTGTFQAPSAHAPGSDRPAEMALPGGQASLSRLEQKLRAASQRNWGRLPGKLQTEILEGGQLPTHPEYARQIQQYFQTIAKPAAEPAP